MLFPKQLPSAGYGGPTTAQTLPQYSDHRASGRLSGTLFVVCVLLSLTLVGQAQSFRTLKPAQQARVAQDLANTLIAGAVTAPIPIIIQTDGSAPQQSAAAGNAPFAASLGTSETYSARLTPSQIAATAAMSNVVHISPDRPVRAAEDYAVRTVGADIALNVYGLTGKGITVAVLDTGIQLHMDLTTPRRAINWVDFVNNRPSPYDDNGHGTHVAGIVCGAGTASTQYRYSHKIQWTAPGINLIGVKVLDKDGNGTASAVIAGINWCIANKNTYGIRVINLSLGHPVAESYKTDPLCQAVEKAWRAGIVVVCAAGNRGRSVASDPNSPPAYGTIDSPANDPYAITVGATNTRGTPGLTDDSIASYSSRGPSAVDFVVKPDIVAPGNQIDSLAAPSSTLYTTYPANQIAPSEYAGIGPVQYFRLSGTSMAAPVVSGAAALLLQANGNLTPDTIKARLMVSAQKYAGGDPFSFGAGLLNTVAALYSTVTAPTGAVSPTAVTNNSGNVLINLSVYGQNVIWGNNVIWGDNKKASTAIYGAQCWTNCILSYGPVWNGLPNSGGTASDAEMSAIQSHGD